MQSHDDEDAEIRISRRQWMDPDQKEKVMGKLKQMMMDPKPMSQELIIETFVKYSLIGFGEASFSDLESYLGHPDIHPDHFPNGLGISAGGTWRPDGISAVLGVLSGTMVSGSLSTTVIVRLKSLKT